MTLPQDVEDRVAALRREGKYREAADVAKDHGAPIVAAALLADAWDYAAAAALAQDAGRLDVAYRHALAGQERGLTAELIDALADHPDQARAAAEFAKDKGRDGDAARLMESAAEVSLAAELFERAGDLANAARCREAEGRYRDAGLLYERRTREAPHDTEAALRLGHILAHFGRYEHAVRALQAAAADEARRRSATRLLVACFAALGLDEAAASRLDELRRADSTLPVTVPEYLEQCFGDEGGIAGIAGGEQREDRLLAGRYRIIRPLGAGATGRVMLAHDGFYEREVAVKVLTVGGGAAGRDAYTRFAREARVAAGLDHPNVVRVFEFNPDGPFLVMEYVAGGTLEDRLAGGEGRVLSLPVIRHVMSSVLTGLEAVHRRGVVHRDLKPANIFFGETGDVKIGDFGVAHLTDLGSTLTGALLGTLAYMAPEQVTGSKRPDAATDLYALGVILHRMLTGFLPFPGPDFVTQHLNETWPPGWRRRGQRRPGVQRPPIPRHRPSTSVGSSSTASPMGARGFAIRSSTGLYAPSHATHRGRRAWSPSVGRTRRTFRLSLTWTEKPGRRSSRNPGVVPSTTRPSTTVGARWRSGR
ncbi:MAG: serine/threonine protein kinase [Deltaproteobacteria bacterium]|nr:serine/threonine protein kinase [Deltaproteobacteria bacterium]